MKYSVVTSSGRDRLQNTWKEKSWYKKGFENWWGTLKNITSFSFFFGKNNEFLFSFWLLLGFTQICHSWKCGSGLNFSWVSKGYRASGALRFFFFFWGGGEGGMSCPEPRKTGSKNSDFGKSNVKVLKISTFFVGKLRLTSRKLLNFLTILLVGVKLCFRSKWGSKEPNHAATRQGCIRWLESTWLGCRTYPCHLTF